MYFDRLLVFKNCALYVYCCVFMQHDSTVAAFLSALKVFNGLQVPYTSAVLVDLFNTSGQFFVEVWYRNESSIDAEPFKLIIPGQYAFCTSTSNDCNLCFYRKVLYAASCLLNYSAFYLADVVLLT